MVFLEAVQKLKARGRSFICRSERAGKFQESSEEQEGNKSAETYPGVGHRLIYTAKYIIYGGGGQGRKPRKVFIEAY